MKSSHTSNAAGAETAEQRLLTHLAHDPDVGPAFNALRAATERFNAIRNKLNDETIEASAVKREAEARSALVRAQALSEIGSASVDDVAAARQEHHAASEALQGISGRDEVLAEELRKVQLEVAELHDSLTEAFATWRADAANAARAVAAEGTRLIRLAAMALADISDGGYIPRHGYELGEWLSNNSITIHVSETPAPIVETSRSAMHLLTRANSFRAEEIRAPRRAPVQAKAVTHIIAPTFSAPGIPHGLTHDALGNVLPEARKVLAQQRAARSAPYEDGRAGVEEVTR